MTLLTIGFFALVAAGLIGLIMAGKLSNQQHPAWSASLIHAGLALTGLGLVIATIASGDQSQRLIVACAIIAGVVLGGLYLAGKHANRRIPPMGIVIGHGLLAVVAIALVGSTLL